MVDLKAMPFNLDDEQIKWVEDLRNEMTVEEKIGQLFFLMGAMPDENMIKAMVDGVKAGGIMYRPMSSQEVSKINKFVHDGIKIPLLVGANLEEGGNGIVTDGTRIGCNLLVAATNDSLYAYKMGEIAIKESKAVGGNMAFAPVIDINYNWENPIANIRSFGDEAKKVEEFGVAYLKGVQDNGGSVTIKHFPGDGVDGRDHHVIKSVNSLSWEDWSKTFGKVYQECINSDATGMMIGHIALPSFYEEFYPDEDKFQPASLSYEIIHDLIRGKLNFNGLIMTDATLMTGFCAEMPREEGVPTSIAAGNDMFLFTKNLGDDYKYMLQGYHKGIITDERLNEAVTRILGLKARLNLHKPETITFENFDVVGKSRDISKEVADKAITLVKNNEALLPINKKVKKIGVISLGNLISMEVEMAKMAGEEAYNYAMANLSHKKFVSLLEKEGFEVEEIDLTDMMKNMEFMAVSDEEFKLKYDMMIYFLKKDTKSNQTNLRIEFNSPAGLDAPWFVKEVPTIAISIANPYHGYDFSMVETFVNCYSNTDEVLESLIDKLMGRSEFKGVSPVSLDFEPFTSDISKWID